MFTLSVRKEAEADILEAFQYYESCQLDLGLDFLNCLELAFEDIQQHPYQYPALHRSIHRTLIRRFPFGVFYTVWEERHCRTRSASCKTKSISLARTFRYFSDIKKSPAVF